MKTVAFALLLICAVAFAADDDVLKLTKDTFSGALEDNDVMLVKFFAPWCGHCKSLAPEYVKAAAALKGVVALAEVDCTEDESVCSQFGVRGYPTLKIFRKGVDEPADYTGGRTEDTIVSYMKKQVAPAVTDIVEEEEAKAFTTSDDVVIVGFFEEGDALEETFSVVANTFRDTFSFGKVVSKEIATALEAEVPSVVVYKKFDEGKAVLADFGGNAEEAIPAFIKAETFKIVDEIHQGNFQSYMDRGLPMVFLFVSTSPEKEEQLEAYEPGCKEMKGIFSCVFLDGERYGKMADRMGADASVLPAMAVDVNDNHYVFEEKFTADNVKAFFKGVNDGSIQSKVRSQPIPESQDKPVTYVVGDQFNDIVLDASKDVFVKFFAPWCGHCKTLAPIYEELATAFADDEHIVIAELDATENDHPGVNIKGFPTMYWFPAGDKENPVEYEGGRELDAMKKWVEEHRTPVEELSTGKEEL